MFDYAEQFAEYQKQVSVDAGDNEVVTGNWLSKEFKPCHGRNLSVMVLKDESAIHGYNILFAAQDLYEGCEGILPYPTTYRNYSQRPKYIKWRRALSWFHGSWHHFPRGMNCKIVDESDGDDSEDETDDALHVRGHHLRLLGVHAHMY